MRQTSTTIIPEDGDRRIDTFFAFLPYSIRKFDWVTDSRGTRRFQYTDDVRWWERVTVEMKYHKKGYEGYERGHWKPERFVDTDERLLEEWAQ